MIKHLLFSSILSFCVTAATHAQSDNEQIALATNALRVTHSCDNALGYLAKVSAAGKATPDYLIAAANANDCKGNNEQAIYFYNKYLEANPANDSVKKRIAELKDAKVLAQKVANEERIAREQYKSSTHKNRKKRPNFEDSYSQIGIGYIKPVGGSDAPYKSGFNFNFGYGFPVINDHAILEIVSNHDFLYNANQPWYRKAFGLPNTEEVSVRRGYMGDLTMGILGVIKNTHTYTWSAGAYAGGRLVALQDVESNSLGDYAFEEPYSFQLCYGARTTFFLGRAVVFYLDYSRCQLSSVTTDNYYTARTTLPIDLSIVRIGCNFKFISWLQ